MHKPRILVVDDDSEAGLNLKIILEKNGFSVLICLSAKEALQVLNKDIPDIILLDVILPDIPGTELCKVLKQDKRFSKIPVVLISGLRTSEEERQTGLLAGAVDYLFRPVANNLLISKIHDVLSHMRDVDDQAAADREMLSFEDLSSRNTRETSAIFNSASLRDQYPESFQYSVDEYNLLIDTAINERFYKVEKTTASRLFMLTENLGFLNAGAKDLMDIHIQCLQTRMEHASLKEQKIVLEETRILLIGLMGNLINYYRRKSF